MADYLSSSIFSLWPKHNSSSKYTNYEFVSLYTPHNDIQRPQLTVHRDTAHTVVSVTIRLERLLSGEITSTSVNITAASHEKLRSPQSIRTQTHPKRLANT